MLQFAAITMEMADWSFFYFSRRERKGWLVRFFLFPLPFGSVRRWTLDGWLGVVKRKKGGGGKKRLEFPVKKKRWKRLLHCDVNPENLFFVFFFFSGKKCCFAEFFGKEQ